METVNEMTEERLTELRRMTQLRTQISPAILLEAVDEIEFLQADRAALRFTDAATVAELEDMRAELAGLKAEKKSLEVESLCAYIDLLKAENERYRLALGRISCGDTGPSDVATAPACCVAYVALAPELAP